MTPVIPIDTIIQGDVLEVLKTIESESIDCCITSPPYYGLRDYGVDGQIGLEDTPEAYVSRLVEVFREVRRVLKDEGTLWLNLGDSYAGSWGNSGHRPELDNSPSSQREKNTEYLSRGGWDQRREVPPNQKVQGCKPKDLIGIPWMVAFALRTDGWYLRSDIIWHKPNPMPESVTDRPTKSHEYMFLLAKSQKYYYDAEAIKEPAIHAGRIVKATGDKSSNAENFRQNNTRLEFGFTQHDTLVSEGRNKRTVWTIPTKPYAEAHFATFPEKLIEPCILAGISEKGNCPACGKAWVRQIEKESHCNAPRGSFPSSYRALGEAQQGSVSVSTKTIGWIPTCSCGLSPKPSTVLDPFFGAGTTGLVARKHLRHWIGIELNPAYCEMARKRLAAIPERLDRWFE